eukprot:CAMPEP_0184498962 /NCGR_PEP_ID=MMETSP0113_2-20130426/40284_1 /TAXON_ID=91329 /ORGANISM="Norrisiella sphaerica, Strain BC52" /LENGTH=44 /DNA_ID= /DNA_START= /DNA_END= /DNA_ORIENTATION=
MTRVRVTSSGLVTTSEKAPAAAPSIIEANDFGRIAVSSERLSAS